MVRQIAHIIIPPREKRSATFRVFTAETTPAEEIERGLLFGCFVVDYYHHRNDEIIDSIIEELQSRYYDSDITSHEPEHLLEETLQALNTTLAQLIENEQIFLNLKRFHAIIGVLKGKFLTFTHVGGFRAYLLHQGVGQQQHFIDLIDTAEGTDEKKSPPITRIFSHVVSGTLRTNDALLFATESLFDYTTKERLQKTIASLPPPRAIEQIKSLAQGERGTVGVLCFLLRLAPDHEARTKAVAEHSLTALQTTEEATRGYLAPSLLRNTVRHVRTILTMGEKVLRTTLRIPDNAPRKEILTTTVRSLLAGIRVSGRFVLFLQRTIGTLMRVLYDITRDRTSVREALTQLQKQGTASVSRFTIRQRVLAIIAGLLALVVIVSTVTMSIQRSRASKKQTYEKNVALIKERIATAEASLLFKDEERTKTIYQEALTLLATLPKKSKQERETKDQLEKEIQQHLEKLRRVIPLARVDVVKDFHELDPAVELTILGIRDAHAYVAHGTRPLLYKVNLENKQTFTLDASGLDVAPITHITQEEKGNVLYLSYATAGIAALDPNKQSVAATDISFGKEGTRLSGITMYNKRLYVLDSAQNQIWRHEKKDGGFVKGVAWLKEAADLNGARAFVIDGALWLAKQDAVVRFVQGKQTNWKMGIVDPPALSFRSVVTSQNSNRLWLLDEAGKRVLAVEKDSGKLLAQYPLPADDIRDFSVNEKTGEILLLTKTKLLKLTYEKQ